MPLVMVLNDGETYTNLEGCKIVYIHDDDMGDDADIKEYGQTVGSFVEADSHDISMTLSGGMRLNLSTY